MANFNTFASNTKNNTEIQIKINYRIRSFIQTPTPNPAPQLLKKVSNLNLTQL